MKKYIFTEEQIKRVIDNVVSEQTSLDEGGDLPTSPTHEYSGYRIEKKDPNSISLKDRLLFIVDNLDGGHTDDSNVTSEQMVELLKRTIEDFVNPNDTISLEEWNDVYYSITKDTYA